MSHDPLAEIAPAEPISDSEVDSVGSEAAKGSGNGEEIVLPSSLTIAEVGELHHRLTERLQVSETLAVDCSGVDVVDGAGLQLLAALNKAAIERQVSIEWQSASLPLRQGIEQLGLQKLLDVD
jgi:anti-anti-sigma regulatory factor